MNQRIEVIKSNFEKINSGALTFLIVHNLGLDIQTGEWVDLYCGKSSIRVQVKHTTNIHLQVNCIAFGFEKVKELSDNELFANAYVSAEQRAEIDLRARTPRHIQSRCATPEDYELKVLREKQIAEFKAIENKKTSIKNREKLKEFNDDLQQIEERFLLLIKGEQ